MDLRRRYGLGDFNERKLAGRRQRLFTAQQHDFFSVQALTT